MRYTKYRGGHLGIPVSKINEIPIPHLDHFIISHVYLKSHHLACLFISKMPLYFGNWWFDGEVIHNLFCITFLASVLTCIRQESANEWYCNTVKSLLLPNTVSQREEKQHTARLDDTAILHVEI